MKIVTLEKVKVTKTLMANAMTFAKSCTYGQRSGAIGSESRSRAELITALVWVVATTGLAVEVTDLFPVTKDNDANEYHLAHRASSPAESRVGSFVRVVMFVQVTAENTKSISGITSTTNGHGRVFIAPR